MQIPALFLSIVTFVVSVIILVKVTKVIKASKEKPQDTVSPRLESLQRDITTVSARLDEITKTNVYLHNIVEKKLTEIRTDNEIQLNRMRETVDEKLQKTLESRISTSFKSVSDRLESVYRQLGEMQNLAKGVGNLEKVLTNVKTRGIWGELQAERILQEILTPEQYVKNVSTKRGSRDVVEFAVKLPGAAEDHQILLPIDSKFPKEDYERLCDATEHSDMETVKLLKTNLEKRVISEAKDIYEKYIDVPFTTDFAILFLPIEGLYAEVLSIAGIQDKLQREYHVLLSGPATLASLLNSLQMGFRTLAIEKKSAEVWHVLGEIKTEFGKFGTTLSRVQDKLNLASKEVEQAFVRQRAMDRKLRNVEAVEISQDTELNYLEYDQTETEDSENM